MGLQLVTDEEVGGRNGTLHQIQQGVSAQFVIIGEHSGLRIVTDSKGMITVTLRAAGRSGHAAYPWRGDNALIKLQASLASLLAAYPNATQEAWRTTINLAKIQTPNQARNQIPALAEAWLDIRYPPDDTNLNGKTIPGITAYLASFCEPGVTPVIEHADPPHHANQHRPEIRSLQHAVTGQATALISSASTAPQTGASTTSTAPTPSFSVSAVTACTAPTSTPTQPPSPPTTRHLNNSSTTRTASSAARRQPRRSA